MFSRRCAVDLRVALESGRLETELLKHVAQVHWQCAIDDDAERALGSVLADQRDCLRKVRVRHAGHGDQELVAQIAVRHRT